MRTGSMSSTQKQASADTANETVMGAPMSSNTRKDPKRIATMGYSMPYSSWCCWASRSISACSGSFSASPLISTR